MLRVGQLLVQFRRNIDQPFGQMLEQKEEGVRFQRIDSDLTDTLKEEVSTDEEEKIKNEYKKRYQETIALS